MNPDPDAITTDAITTDAITTRLLAPLMQTDAEQMERLHARLVDDATESGVLDVAYRTIPSPIGALLLAATEVGLVRVAFAAEDHDLVLEQLAHRISPRVLLAPDRLEDAAMQIAQYFGGERTEFHLPLDLRLSSGFRREVLEHLPEIAYGHTASYASVAELAGRPRAVRAVGTACATNPLPVVVPCHRVVRSDGTIGAYLGGTGAKVALLELEAA